MALRNSVIYMTNDIVKFWSDNLLYILLGIGVIIVLLGMIEIVAHIHLLSYAADNTRHEEQAPEELKPVIGYKRSIMTIDKVDKKNNIIDVHFEGVSNAGRSYSMESVRAPHTPGFYMYNLKNINRAKTHEQWGNVMLEVLGYGAIDEYDKGYITEKQKVLQIIVDKKNIREDPTTIAFLIKNKLTLKDLYTKNWTGTDGSEIIFSPLNDYSYSSKMKKYTIPAYSPTVLKNADSLVESN